MYDIPLNDLDFTENAWESLYDAVDDEVFVEQDARLIYSSLKHRLKYIRFGDYLKRYIYLKAELTEPFNQVDIKDYQFIIKNAFADNNTPPSFTPTTAKLSALSKNWLTQQTVKRNVVFLLGFGLNMSVEDVNMFLTKALREPEINPKNPFEAICMYCFKNGYNYLRFEKLWDMYNQVEPNTTYQSIAYSEHTVGVRNSMYSSTYSDEGLIAYLSRYKTTDNSTRMSVTARECFDELYDQARQLVADLYNKNQDDEQKIALNEYWDKLSRNDRLYDYEKKNRLEDFRNRKTSFTKDDISESDIEHIICASIPTDRHGNLTPSKASELNEQFSGRRFSRQRIGEILSGNTEINRFDLITLNFFIHSQKLDIYPEAKQRYVSFLDTTNAILEKCSMGKLYVQNPYECFVLMCILSLDPLGTYADVWELSYNKD